MPVTTTVRVEGLRELGEAMRTLSSDIANKVSQQATGSSAQVVKAAVKARMRANPSVDSGLLEKNVISKKIPKSQTYLTSQHIVTIRKRDYPKQRGKARRNTRQVAMYLEYGTVKMTSEPSIGPGFETSKTKALDAITGKLRQRLDAVRPK